MNWPAHIMIGALFGIILSIFLNVSILEGAVLTAFAAFCALAPDIDHDSSKIRKISNITVPITALGFSFASTCTDGATCTLDDLRTIILIGLAITGCYMVIITFFRPRHRGITHTIFASLIFAVLIYVFSDLNFALAGFAGYSSHLVADRHIKVV